MCLFSLQLQIKNFKDSPLLETKMTATRQTVQTIYHREFWTEFFLLYKKLPALWDVHSPLYKKRGAKLVAYDILLNKLREQEPKSDREDVLRKINIFRTNYRRECARVAERQRMGKSYTPTLWYFHTLDFLQPQELRRNKIKTEDSSEKCILRRRWKIPNKSSGSIGNQRTSSLSLEPIKDNEYYGKEIFKDTAQMEDCDSSLDIDQHTYHNEFKTFSLKQNLPGENIEPSENYEDFYEGPEVEGYDDFITEIVSADEQPESTMNRLNGENIPSGIKTESANGNTLEVTNQLQLTTRTHSVLNNKKTISYEADILAKSWAIQYDEIPNDQKVYARKAIADILFDGCRGKLDTRTCNEDAYNNATIDIQNETSQEFFDGFDSESSYIRYRFK